MKRWIDLGLFNASLLLNVLLSKPLVLHKQNNSSATLAKLARYLFSLDNIKVTSPAVVI